MSRQSRLVKYMQALVLGGTLCMAASSASAYQFRVFTKGITPSAANLSTSPGSLSFASLIIGQSGSAAFTLSNSGQKPATAIQYSLPAGYTLTGNCGTTLAGGAQCSGTVTFAPTVAQPYSGTISITAAEASTAVGLSGTGLPLPLVQLTNASGTWKYADGTLAASCLAYRSGNTGYATATASGLYQVNMGAGAETVFCDMTTSGGGWTLVARSAPGGTSSGNFGWYGVEGAVSNVSAPYSIGVLNKNLPFTQILFGDAPGNANAWGAHINMNNASRATLVANQSTNVWIGVPTAISSSASTGFAMADYMGFTSVDTNIYYFRDVTPNAGYGLAAWGWDTAYGNGTSDVGGQAFGASYGGFINNSQGLLMVR